MDYKYGEYDGQGFLSPDELFPPQKVMQFILQYGQDALDAMNEQEGDVQDLIQQLIDAGYMERDPETGELRLTPQMIKGLEHRALLEIFQDLKQSGREGHATQMRGRSDERADGTHPYEFGDPISEIDFGATMRNALHRQVSQSGDSSGRQAKLPLQIGHEDFELHVTDSQANVATCILLDMSGSMMRWGRFYQAKRVALGLQALANQRFPMDTVDFVGFYSLAEAIPEQKLPLVMPKPVSIRDWEVRLRVELDQAIASPEKIPQHFTNLHMGLRQARQVLARRGAMNKQIFIITDGQPTAHVEPNPQTGGETLYLLYPPAERTSTITLEEAMRCRQAGIRIASFALIEDYWGMDWVGFINQLTRLTRGIAYYCSSDDLSSTVIESFLSGRKKKSFIG